MDARLSSAALLAGALVMASAARASPVITSVGADLTQAPYSFSFEGGTFTFSSTGDPFNPLAVETSGNAEVSAFGGFAGIPVQPTSDFVNRGTVIYGPGQYAAFSAPTTVPYSNGDNYIGLEVTNAAADYYGFAYTTNTVLNGYGFDTTPGAAITPTTSVSATPEPAAWSMMIIGVAMVGRLLRRSRRKPALALSAA